MTNILEKICKENKNFFMFENDFPKVAPFMR
jgi:hypothetical protein